MRRPLLSLALFGLLGLVVMLGAVPGSSAAPPPAWGNAIQVPGTSTLNSGTDAGVDAVSCATSGNCAAGGHYTDGAGRGQVFVGDETNGTWGNAIQIPGTAALNTGSGGAQLSSMSCATAGNCAAGGYYTDGSGKQQAFVVDETNGSWGTAIEVPGTAALNTLGYARVNSVSCAAPGDCAAGGWYRDTVVYDRYDAFVVSESNGTWGNAVEVPGTAALNIGGYGVVTSVECAAAGDCVAGGDYEDGSHNKQAFVADESNGTWGNAIEVPGTAALNTYGFAVVQSISCSAAGECAAGGTVEEKFTAEEDFTHDEVFVVTESNGTWGNAIEVPGAHALNAGGYAEVTSISCTAAGECGAGGFYTDGVTAPGYFHGRRQAFVISESNGTWGTAVEAPGTAALNHGGANLYSLSCGATGECAGGGTYQDASGGAQAFVIDETNGSWGNAIEVPGTAALNSGGYGLVNSVSCASPTFCVAGGSFQGYGKQAFVADFAIPPKADQTIHVSTGAPSRAVYGTGFTVAATGGGSGNPVTYGSSGGCTNSGADFTMTSGSSDCTVTYDEAGNATYNAAPQVTETVTATKADQAITFAAPANHTYGDANFNPGATASSGNAISYGASGACAIASGKVHLTGAGSCTITANQAGDVDYNAAPPVQRTFSVGKAALSITANNRQKYFDQAPALGTTAFMSSGLVGSDSVSGVALTSAGATATAASGNYSIVPSSAVAGPGTSLGNYTVSYHSGTLHVLAVGIIGLRGVSVATSAGKIDSFNSAAGAYSSSNHGSAALVMSNGQLSFAGVALLGSAESTQSSASVAKSASVSGNVTVGTTASILGSVGGTVTQNSPTTALSAPTVSACSPYSGKSGISGGSVTYAVGTGNLTVKSGTVKLANKTFCFNNLTLAAGAKLSVGGSVTIHLRGKLTGKGQLVNKTNRSANLHIDTSFVGSGGVAIVGDSHACMTILAPKTTVTIAGGSFFGTLLAGTVNLTGGTFHADMH